MFSAQGLVAALVRTALRAARGHCQRRLRRAGFLAARLATNSSQVASVTASMVSFKA